MIRPLVLLGHPSLRQPCQPVADAGSDEVQRISRDLHDTLTDLRRRLGIGRGLAAPQIGSRLRVVSLLWPQPTTLINPEVIDTAGEQLVWDDCFSIPGLVMQVRRAAAVTVSYTNAAGRRQQLEADGALAELLQHELDHLDGVLALDRVVAMTDVMARSEWERQQA